MDFCRVENDTLVTGYRQTSGWARTRTVYFAMVFSNPLKVMAIKNMINQFIVDFTGNSMKRRISLKWLDERSGPILILRLKNMRPLKMKFALSAVSTEGAIKNLKAEIPHWNFGKTRMEAKEKWNKELSKIKVETKTPDEKIVFYTALYHAFISPIIYEDVDGQYRGLGSEHSSIRWIYQLYHFFIVGYLSCFASIFQSGATRTK